MLQRINWLNRIESSIEDFEKGLFYGADISRCVAESEIHIINNCKSELAGKGRVNILYNCRTMDEVLCIDSETWIDNP